MGVGAYSLAANTTASNNVGIGYGAGDAITTGGTNTAVGGESLGAVTTATGNTAIGHNSGNSATTSGSNTLLGRDTQPSAADSGGHEISIGANATGKGSSTGFMNANGGANYAGNNSASWSTTSDRRIKKNIEDNNTGLDKINDIRVRNFEYRLPEEVDPELPQSAAIDKEGIQVGVIAQEIINVLPEMVTQEDTGCYSVDPNNLTWYLVNAVKELSTKVEDLEKQLNNKE